MARDSSRPAGVRTVRLVFRQWTPRRGIALFIYTFHSFVFAIVPVGVFLVANVKQLAVPPGDALRSISWLALGNVALLMTLAPLLGLRPAAVTLTALYVSLYFYTVGYRLIATAVPTTPEWLIALGYTLAALSWSLWTGRPPVGEDRRYQTLNVAAGTLVVVCSAMLTFESRFVAGRRWATVTAELAASAPAPVHPPEQPPDIYYIVLDGLGRADVLREKYGVDLVWELGQLRELGWSIPQQSRANYSQTYLSLASALNGTYLDPIADLMQYSRDRRALHDLIQRAGPIAALKRFGYRFRLIGSNTSVTDSHDQADECHCEASGLNEFENGLLTITPFRALPLYEPTFGSHYASVLNAFARLATPPSEPHPQLVLAHIIVPHPPFVLDREGRPLKLYGPLVYGDGDHFAGTLDEYRRGYAEQALFTMRTLITLSRKIREHRRPAIIIAHGDHGPGALYSHRSLQATTVGERFPIFLGMMLGRPSDVPEDLSPVNVWRVVMNTHFGAREEPLPNRSYYSTWESPYDLTEVVLP